MRSALTIIYYADGRGRWIRREWPPQCSVKVLFLGRCQGVKGHKGIHWRYSESGNFWWEDNDNDSTHDARAGCTPPGNKEWVSPLKMQKHCFVSQCIETDVTDKAIIAMLEKGKTPERDAAIDRPVKLNQKRKKGSSLKRI